MHDIPPDLKEENKSDTTGVASGAGTTYPSEAPEFTLVGFIFHNI